MTDQGSMSSVTDVAVEGDVRPHLIDTGFDMSTMQGVFDHVVAAMLHQDGRAYLSHVLDEREIVIGEGLWSAYRTTTTRSPIGFLIVDARYGKELELLHLHSRDASGRRPVQDAMDHRISRDAETIDLIWTLQKVHDRPRGRMAGDPNWRTEWKRKMRNVAILTGLDASSLDMPWPHETAIAEAS